MKELQEMKSNVAKKYLEISPPVAELKMNYEQKFIKSIPDERFHELAAINEFQNNMNTKDAERSALYDVANKQRERKPLSPQMLKYWSNIFNGAEELKESELVAELLKDEMLKSNAGNNTKMLNIIFSACYDGYVTMIDLGRRLYKINKDTK